VIGDIKELLISRIKPRDIQAKLELSFEADLKINLRVGQVLFPREYTSVRHVIVSLLPQIEKEVEFDPDDGYASLEAKLFDYYGPSEVLEWFVDEGPSSVVIVGLSTLWSVVIGAS
jgi:hypothetical protein